MKDARWMKLDNRTNVIVTLCANTGFSQVLAAGEIQFHNIGPRSFRCWLAAVSWLWVIVGNIIPPWLARHRFQCRLAAVWRLFQHWQHYSAIVGGRRIRCCSLQFAVRCWLAAVPMMVSYSFPTLADVGNIIPPLSARHRFRWWPAAECQCWLNAGLWCKIASSQHWLQCWVEVDKCGQLHLANTGPTMQCLLGMIKFL